MINSTEFKINPRQLTYEILISKGLGKLTTKAQKMLYELNNHAIIKNKKKFKSEDDLNDCLQESHLVLLTNWYKFDPDVTSNAFAYYTEIHKRATTDMFNQLYLKKGIKKEDQKYIQNISINSSNNGQGLFNV